MVPVPAHVFLTALGDELHEAELLMLCGERVILVDR
jgi:hypothetical protein